VMLHASTVPCTCGTTGATATRVAATRSSMSYTRPLGGVRPLPEPPPPPQAEARARSKADERVRWNFMCMRWVRDE
jgi:hypothetical protein